MYRAYFLWHGNNAEVCSSTNLQVVLTSKRLYVHDGALVHNMWYGMYLCHPTHTLHAAVVLCVSRKFF